MSVRKLLVLPDCDVCVSKGAKPPRKAKYDSYLTQYDRHGFTCPTHFREYGVRGGSFTALVRVTDEELRNEHRR